MIEVKTEDQYKIILSDFMHNSDVSTKVVTCEHCKCEFDWDDSDHENTCNECWCNMQSINPHKE
jgi:hypothetical protein